MAENQILVIAGVLCTVLALTAYKWSYTGWTQQELAWKSNRQWVITSLLVLGASLLFLRGFGVM